MIKKLAKPITLPKGNLIESGLLKRSERLLFKFAKLSFVSISLIIIIQSKASGQKKANFLIQLNNLLTEHIIADQFSPPVASRIYVYPNLVAERWLNQETFYQLYPFVPRARCPIANVKSPNNELTAALAFVKVASKLIYNSDSWNSKTRAIVEQLAKKCSKETQEASAAYANESGNIILSVADQDGYKQRLTFVRYTVTLSDSTWQPTPPAYSDPVEPYWGTIKPIATDTPISTLGFAPLSFSKDANSAYQLQVQEVINLAKHNTDSTLNIARHWDCNPIQLGISGHIMQFSYRMTPAGHWIAVAADLLQIQDTDAQQSASLLSRLSVVCFDAFIDCWKMKYQFNAIRPVTVINNQGNPDWRPAIETPLFPEYPSGHSEVSAAASVILTDFLGEDFAFVDSSQRLFGLPSSAFKSFKAAAQEAGESRILGGIHFRKAVEDGYRRGLILGEAVRNKLKRE